MNRPFRNSRVHVLRDQCSTCIFRPGNLMHLQPGRIADMVREAVAADSAIICHQTLDTISEEAAVCKGFFYQHATQPLQVAERLGYINWVATPPGRDRRLGR